MEVVLKPLSGQICMPVLIPCPISGLIWVLSSYITSAKGVILVYSQCAGGYIQGEQPWRRYILGEHPYQSGYGSRYQYGHAYVHVNFSFLKNLEFWKFCVFVGGGGVGGSGTWANMRIIRVALSMVDTRVNSGLCNGRLLLGISITQPGIKPCVGHR